MNEQKNNGRGIFYGVIGVATLVVAIIGATFAYFTASASNNNVIEGNMATITFALDVDKVTKADETKGGMIPMSNSMVEAALNGKNDVTGDNGDDPEICVDDNGNAVCQIYKITVQNGGTAGMFLDGYVSLTGGSGVPTDVSSWTNITGEDAVKTTMRWAQVFCNGTDNQLTSCTTAGVTTTGATAPESAGTDDKVGLTSQTSWAAISLASTSDTGNDKGKNTAQIVSTGADVVVDGVISGNTYDIINKNYIRISDHAETATGYNRNTDVTSALVFNQFIAAKTGTTEITTSTDSTETYTDAQVFYIVVWLSETGTNQTADSTGAGAFQTPEGATPGADFFKGNVTFVSAQGSEVTATFSGYTAVTSDQANLGQTQE